MSTPSFIQHATRWTTGSLMMSLVIGALAGGALFFGNVRELVAQPPSRTDVDRLIADLKSDDWSVRAKAAGELEKIGDARAVGPLFDCLKQAADQGKVQWKNIAAALQRMKAPGAVDEYIKHLNEGVAIAAWGLRNYPGPRAVNALVAVLLDKKYEGVSQFHRNAAESLAELKDARAVEPLIAGLKDQSEAVRFNAAFPLGAIGDRRAVEPLIQVLKADEANFVRLRAAMSLGEIGDLRAVQPLVTALQQDKDSYVRYQSAIALGKIGDPNATAALKAAQTDKDSQVREAAMDALRKIEEAPKDDPAPRGGVVSSPANGATNVDPATKTISITFAGDMRTDGYTVVPADGGSLPEPIGTEPYTFRDARTFVMSVHLSPDTAYAFSLNSARRQGFKAADGTPLLPTVIRFRTGTGQATSRPQPEALDEIIVTPTPRGPAEFKTIGEAVKQAKSGAKISVFPGTYAEHLVLDRPVTLTRKDGERGEVVIESTDGSCILVKTDKAQVKGLTLRNRAATKNSKFFGILVMQGEAVVEDCDITADSLSAVCVDGQGSRVTLRRCKLHDAKQAGVFVYQKSQGTIEDCEVFGNGNTGVAISDGGEAVVRRCTIRDNMENGAFVLDKGQGTLEDCDVSGNARAGVQVRAAGSKLTARNCKFHDGKQGGVFVNEKSEATLEGCEVFSNALAGVEASSGGSATLRNCKIHSGKQGGVYALDKAEGTFEDCDIYGNTYAGIQIRTGAKTVVRNCKIHDGKQGGVFVNDAGEGTIEGCEIYGNGLAGIEIATGGKPSVRRCTMRDGKHAGLHAHAKGEGMLDDCEFFGNGWCEVAIATESSPTLRGCTIRDGKQSGVFVFDRGAGTFEKCTISGNTLAGIETKDGGNPLLRDCKIQNGKQNGVYVNEKGVGTFEDCAITGNGLAGVQIGAEANPILRRCKILDNKAEGVVARPQSRGTLEGCEISGNLKQVVEMPGADLTLRDNRIAAANSNSSTIEPNGPDRAVPPAAKTNRNNGTGRGNEKDAIAFIEGLGGMVKVDEEAPGKPVVVVDLSGAKDVSAEAVARLREFRHLKALRLGGARVDDATLKQLGNLTGLLALDLHGSQITDAGLVHLQRLTRLEELDLEDTPIGDAGLAQIKVMTRMEELILGGTKVTDAGLIHLRKMFAMKHLVLNGTRVTDAGLASLKDMLFMEVLHLVGAEITDAGLDHLEAMALLRELDLSFTKVGNEGLKRINEYFELERLVLVETPITDAGLVHLRGMKKLKELNINLTAITPAGFRSLKQALPKTNIVYTPPTRNLSARPTSNKPSFSSRPRQGAPLALEAAAEEITTAAREGNLAVVRDLLGKGVAADAQDKQGVTALMYAAVNGHEQVASFLLNAGAKLDMRDDLGWTPLHWATSGNAEIVKLFLTKGADPNAADKIGDTPLMNAAHLALPDIAELLLEKGANPRAVSRDGRTAMDMAARSSKGPKALPVLEKWAVRWGTAPTTGSTQAPELLPVATSDEGDAVQTLLRDLKDANDTVRLRAAKTLGKLGPAARTAVPALRDISRNDPDEDVRLVAANALTRIAEAVNGTPSGTSPNPAQSPSKVQAVQLLKQFVANLERQDYDKAIALMRLPAQANMDAVKEGLKAFLERKEVSRAGIDVLAAKGKWGPLADVIGAERAGSFAKRAGIAVEACFGIAFEDAEAFFHWDGTQFRLLRCDDVGQLSADAAPVEPASASGDSATIARPASNGRSLASGRPSAPARGGERRITYANPIAGFQIDIPEDWEMATGAAGNIEIAIDAETGSKLWGQPALWFYYAPQPPDRNSKQLADALQLLGGRGVTVRQNSATEWQVTASFNVPFLGEVTSRWLCRGERGMSYVIGVAVRSTLAAQFRDDMDTALRTCRLIDHPVIRCFHEPTERAYRILLPEGWRWEGAIIRTREVPGWFTWKASSPDGTTACFTGPPAAFNMFQDYVPAEQQARGIVLDGMRTLVRDAQLENVTLMPRANEHFREGLRLFGLNSKFDKVRADYVGTVNGVRVRARVEIVTWMPQQSNFPDRRLYGRGDWFVIAAGAWAPADRFDELYPLARSVHASLRISPVWIKRQREAIGKVLVDRISAMDEAMKGWDAYIRDMERIPDPAGGEPQEVPNRDGTVWMDPDGIMHRVPRNDRLEQALRNRGWKWIR